MVINVEALSLGTEQAYLPHCQELAGFYVALYDVIAQPKQLQFYF